MSFLNLNLYNKIVVFIIFANIFWFEKSGTKSNSLPMKMSPSDGDIKAISKFSQIVFIRSDHKREHPGQVMLEIVALRHLR